MRVLTAAHYWPPHVGGVEFEAREQSRRLVARGHEVTVVSSRIADDRALSFDDGFPVHKVAASNVLEDRLRLPYPLYSPQLFSVMSRLARDADVVVAHTHTFMSTVAAARAARRHGKPFVLIQNNPYIEYRFPLDLVQRAADATIGRYTIGSADRLVAISEFTADYLERLAPRPAGHRHAPRHRRRAVLAGRPRRNGTRSAGGSGCPADAFVAFTVRRLFYRNGLDTLLDAAARLRDQRRRARRDRRLRARSGARSRTRIRRDGLEQRAPRRASSPTPTCPTTTAPPTCSCSRRAPPRASGSC